MCRLRPRSVQHASLNVDSRKKFISDYHCINQITEPIANAASHLEIPIPENKSLCLFNLNIYVCVCIYAFVHAKFLSLESIATKHKRFPLWQREKMEITKVNQAKCRWPCHWVPIKEHSLVDNMTKEDIHGKHLSSYTSL